MKIGQRIREVREDLGMQAAVLARRVEVAPNTIYRIEAGDRTPSVALLEKIACELRTEPAELMREPAVPLAKAPPPGPESEYNKEDRLEILRRMEMAILVIVRRCRLDLETIDTGASD